MIAFKELLVRAKRGEEKAFEELFEQFEPLVRKCSYMNGHTDGVCTGNSQVQNIKQEGGEAKASPPSL